MRARLSRRPAPQEREHLRPIVMVSLFELSGALRVQQPAGVIKDKEVREPLYLRITREDALVLVPRAIVDLDDDKVLLQEAGNVLVVVEELIELLAPNAPLAAHIEQHPSPAPLRFRNAGADVLLRIAGGVKLSDRNVTRLRNPSGTFTRKREHARPKFQAAAGGKVLIPR